MVGRDDLIAPQSSSYLCVLPASAKLSCPLRTCCNTSNQTIKQSKQSNNDWLYWQGHASRVTAIPANYSMFTLVGRVVLNAPCEDSPQLIPDWQHWYWQLAAFPHWQHSVGPEVARAPLPPKKILRTVIAQSRGTKGMTMKRSSSYPERVRRGLRRLGDKPPYQCGQA